MSSVDTDITSNSMYDVYRKLMVVQIKRVLPPQIENEILDVQTNSSLNDFNYVKYKRLGFVFNLFL